MDQKKWNVIGLMSGTSLDGIDAALVRIDDKDETDIELVSFISLPYSDELRRNIMKICDPITSKTEDLSPMNFLLGELFAEAAFKVAEEAGIPLTEVDLISSHGQTVFHQPEKIVLDGREITSTLQIGDIAVIAERTGITTVGDFRTRDMAAGGQGAPLVPFADYYLFKRKEFGRVLVNIGGIANITVLPPNCEEYEVLAYDTGPGNMMIDLFTYWATEGKQVFDRDGNLAARGKVNGPLLELMLSHPYFQEAPPKSTGREEFGKIFAGKLWDEAEQNHISLPDRIATVTKLTAITLTDEINKFIDKHQIQEVLISGGGWNNKSLMKMVRESLPDSIKVLGTEEYGLNSDAKEAIVFALLGLLCYKKKTNNLPAATGATHPVIMGKIAW